jgi:hypothetical protein
MISLALAQVAALRVRHILDTNYVYFGHFRRARTLKMAHFFNMSICRNVHFLPQRPEKYGFCID